MKLYFLGFVRVRRKECEEEEEENEEKEKEKTRCKKEETFRKNTMKAAGEF